MGKVTNNIGDWSEIYVLFKLLADQKIYCADIDTNKLQSLFYSIYSIIRNETKDKIKYKKEFKINNSNVIIIEDDKASTAISIPISNFDDYATKLFKTLKERKKDPSIKISENTEIKDFMTRINNYSVPTDNTEKSDITIKLHDALSPELGFSIKSHIGGAPTLVNASGATNFIFKINDKEFINKIYPYEDKERSEIIKLVKEHKPDLEFYGMSNETFYNNLILLDSNLPFLISEMLKKHYIEKKHKDNSKVTEIITKISQEDKCNVPDSIQSIYYEYKIKDYLQAVALGMNPATEWKGDFEATGGYIIVKEDGDVLCFHIYNRNDLREYLYKNTKLETPSTSPKKRHDYGYIYELNGELFINLNLQIRFIK